MLQAGEGRNRETYKTLLKRGWEEGSQGYLVQLGDRWKVVNDSFRW